jgi:hypothetical protein
MFKGKIKSIVSLNRLHKAICDCHAEIEVVDPIAILLSEYELFNIWMVNSQDAHLGTLPFPRTRHRIAHSVIYADKADRP